MGNALANSFNPLDYIKTSDKGEEYYAELMRNNIGEIIGSYHHQFDHLYECIQNAVDACEKAYWHYQDQKRSDYVPEINISLDLDRSKFAVLDNGVGMSRESVQKYFFTPYGTLKKSGGSNRQRGEKGVGATFLSYGVNYIKLSTKDIVNGEIASGELVKGLTWARGEIDLLPMPLVVPVDPEKLIQDAPHGTMIILNFGENTNIGDPKDHGNTLDQWEVIFRIHTAIGFIDLDNNDPFLKSLQVSLSLTYERNESKKYIETGYYFPHMLTKAQVQLSKLQRKKGQLLESQRDMDIMWDAFNFEQVSEFIIQRMENVRYLRDNKKRMIVNVLKKHKPQAYMAFTHASEFWDDHNRKIWGNDGIEQFHHGIVYATRSQKIGEQARIDFTFRSGDFNRAFILLSMENLKADIGRKSLPEEVDIFANFFANAVHDKFTDEDDCLRPNSSSFDETQERELEALLDKAYELEPIDAKGLDFVKTPKEEQDVIALFFDLLGKGIIRGYEIYSTHIHRTYDGVGKFYLQEKPENIYDPKTNRLGIAKHKFVKGVVESPKRCYIEFKYSTDGIVKDVMTTAKRLQDIKWLICWEVGTAHAAEDIGITDITEPSQINQRDYYGVTHIMTERTSRVFVIELKKVLKLFTK
jgi:hypothetical protein